MNQKIIVIGAGAAGLMAAYSAAQSGADVVLLERSEKPGKKLLITGKGRCNFTNSGDLEDFIKNIPGNSSFIYSAFSKFNNWDTMNFFYERGTPYKIERGGRVFPESDKASDIVKTLYKAVSDAKVNISFNKRVKRLLVSEKSVKGVKLETGEEMLADKVIVATGGLSFPQTGSTGDGYKLAKESGHTVTKLYPSLVGLKTKEKWVKSLAGLTLKNVSVKVFKEQKEIYTDFGELLFTHVGISGPTVISASSHMVRESGSSFSISIDLKPALSEKELDNRIMRDIEKSGGKNLKNLMHGLLPSRLIPIILNLCQLKEDKPSSNITKEERRLLVKGLKNFSLNIYGTEGYDRAVITSGGISLSEISPKTMESKLVKGLYFAGEVLDLDGYTGGYNLQIAFSTGWLSGQSSAE